ncbi:MAG: hypothetical protein NZ922_02350 [Candidatus Methanomethyliaceae archaeon]|nr:hypothetical protein [Candidatus Methanomethyliaceae archaeon]MDW7970995.1 hypothetical protein [Nitrososphaerota archaeon]
MKLRIKLYIIAMVMGIVVMTMPLIVLQQRTLQEIPSDPMKEPMKTSVNENLAERNRAMELEFPLGNLAFIIAMGLIPAVIVLMVYKLFLKQLI